MTNMEKHVRNETAARIRDKISFKVGWEICMDSDHHFCKHVCPNRKECTDGATDSQITELGEWAMKEAE